MKRTEIFAYLFLVGTILWYGVAAARGAMALTTL
jgi:hypothetical protein